jgi:hypothetical protein
MSLESALQEHTFMKVERPPSPWQPSTGDAQLKSLLQAIVAAAKTLGAPSEDLTFNVSNVVVERFEDEIGPQIPSPGEYLAITIRGNVDLGPDARWSPPESSPTGLLAALHPQLLDARATFAYIRSISTIGSLTVFLPRAIPQ